MEEEAVRVRLVFHDRRLLSGLLRSQGLERSWLLLRPGLVTVSDVAAHIIDSFGLQSTCPDGVLLSMDDFILPPFESARIFKEEDVIRVKKKRSRFREAIKGTIDANPIGDTSVENKPLLLCSEPLENEEFEKELGCYVSEEECGNCDKSKKPNYLKSIVLEAKNLSPKRKRKHSHGSQTSRKKKYRISSPEKLIGDAEATMEKQIQCFLQKEAICQQIIHKKSFKSNRSSNAGGMSAPISDDNEACGDKAASVDVRRKNNKISNPEKFTAVDAEAQCFFQKEADCQRVIRKKSGGSSNAGGTTVPTSDGNETGEDKTVSVDVCEVLVQKHEGIERALPLNGGTKKVPSRSACRKKAKRLWLRNQANSARKDPVQNVLPESYDHKKSPEHGTVFQNADGEGEMIPIVVGPGHIRFEPLDEELNRQHRPAQATLQWNGTSNKKKGQKWGREKNFMIGTDNKSNFNEQSNKKCHAEAMVPVSVESKQLAPLTHSPKEGDVIAYQLVELSSSWCPEISSVRLGKVKLFDPTTMNSVLEPVPGHPIKVPADKTDEESTEQSIPSLYNEDGSLEIDFSSLINVRVFVGDKVGDTVLSHGEEEAANCQDWTAQRGTGSNGKLDHFTREAAAPISEKKGCGVWEEIDEALRAKKAELGKDSWSGRRSANEHSSITSWTFRALRRSAIGPTVSLLRAGKSL